MQVDAESMVYAGIGIGVGIFFFIQGFRDLKIKRIIQNIPTSKISTGAVGSDVEIKGKVVCEADKLVSAPISQTPCALYSIEIQVLVKSKNSSNWKTIDRYYSNEGIYLDDNSGSTALVMVDGAKITRKGNPVNYRIRSNQFDEMPGLLRDSLTSMRKKLKRFKLKETSWMFSKDYRFLEWCFQPGELLYVLGYADSGFKVKKKKKVPFKIYQKARKMVETDEKLKLRFDTNKDGVLDPEELERGAMRVANKLHEKYSKDKLEELVPKTKMIFKHTPPHPFYISNMKEEDLVKRFGFASVLKIWGGPILSIACSLFLMFQLGWIN